MQASDLVTAVLGERSATDGDTFLSSADGSKNRVLGIDAPEIRHFGDQTTQPGGATATQILESVLGQATFDVEGTDDYGRNLVRGEINDQPLDEVLIRSGAALPFGATQTDEQRNALQENYMRTISPLSRTAQDEALAADRASIEHRTDLTPNLDRSEMLEPEGTWSRAVDRGMANLAGSFGAAGEFLGDRFGVDSLKKMGSDTVARSMIKGALNPAAIGDHENIKDLADLGTWVVEKVGENVPNMASLVVGGMVGAGGRVALAGIGKSALKEAVSAAAKREIRNKLLTQGARAGAIAAIYPQHLGESVQELKAGGIDTSDKNTPFLAAAINTALDVAPMEMLLKYSFGGLKAEMAKDLVRQSFQVMSGKEVFKKALKGIGKGAVAGASAEFPTELTQELVNLSARAYHDPTFDVFSDENIHRMVEAGLAGGTVGAVFGAGGRGSSETARAVYDYLGQQQAADPTVEPDDGQLPPDTSGAASVPVPPSTPAEASQASPVAEAAPATDPTVSDPAPTPVQGPAPIALSDQRPAEAQPLASENDPFFEAAVQHVTSQGFASPSSVQRQFKIGYNRAARMVEEMERAGVVGPMQPNGQRKVLPAQQAPEAEPAPVEQTPKTEQAPPAEAQATTDQLTLSANQWDRDNRTNRSVEWQAAAAEAGPAFDAVSVEGATIPAHGMAKVGTLTEGLKQLISILNGGIDPNRTLFTDALTAPTNGAGAGTGTAGGHAYRDGPFILVFRQGLVGQPTAADIRGVLVNSAHADVATALQSMFPNLVIRDFNGVADVVAASTDAAPVTPAPVSSPEEEPQASSFLNEILSADEAEAELGGKGEGAHFTSGEPHEEQIDLLNRGKNADNSFTKAVNADSAVAGMRGVKRVLDTVRHFIAGVTEGYDAPAYDLPNQKDIKDAGAHSFTLSVNDPAPRQGVDPERMRADVNAFTNPAEGQGLSIKLKLPTPEEMNGVTPTFVKHIIRSAWSGALSEENRVSLRTPDGKADVHFNIPELVSAGRAELGGKNESLQDSRHALLSAVSWLISQGYNLKGNKLDIDNEAKVARGKNAPTWAKVRSAKSAVTDYDPIVKELKDEALGPAYDGAMLVFAKLVAQRKESDQDGAYRRSIQGISKWIEALEREQERRAFAEQRDPRGTDFENTDAVGGEYGGEPSQNAETVETPDTTTGPTGHLPMAPARPTTVEVPNRAEDPRLAKESEFITTILREAGVKLKHLVSLTDIMGIARLIQEQRDAYAAANNREGGKDEKAMARAEYNAALLKQAADDVQTARVVFLKVSEHDVRPVIVISDSIPSGSRRARALLHEAGHVVMRHFLSDASAEAKEQMSKVWGEPGTTEFEENFAEAFVRYALEQTRAAAKNDPARGRIHAAIKSLFDRMVQALRRLWARGRKEADVTYSEFIELLVNRRRRDMGEREFNPKTEFGKAMKKAMETDGDARNLLISADGPAYLNLTPAARAAVTNKAKKIIDSPAGDAVKGTAGTLNEFYNAWFRGEDAVLRRMGNKVVTRLADHFRREPGKQTIGLGARFDDEVRGLLGGIQPEIEDIATKHVPGFKPWHLLPFVKSPEPSETMQKAVDLLLREEKLPDSNEPEVELARRVRQIFEKLYRWLESTGVRVPYRQNYFPVAMNVSKLLESGAHAKVRGIFKAWAETDAAKEWWQGKKDRGQIEDSVPFPDPEKFADHMYSVWTGTGGTLEMERTLLEGNVESQDFLSPGFSHRKQRQLPRELIRDLAEFRERDLVQIMTAYTRSAVKRGVWQQRFGSPKGGAVYKDLMRFKAAFEQAKRIDQTTLSRAHWGPLMEEYNAAKEEYLKKWNVDLNDPSAQLKIDLIEEVRAGRLTQQDYDRITQVSIPSYMGTLGIDFNIGGKARPGLRRLSQLMMVYQGVRVLSLGVLSQFVDVATIAARIEGDDAGKAMRAAVKSMSGAGKAERLKLARTFGILQSNITEHMLNDETGVLGFSRNLQNINETFFKYNGMHVMTNWARSVDLMIAKSLIESWAEEGDARKLGEIGITLEQARAWKAEGSDLTWNDKHSTVLGGINQFIDESMVRPTAALRPRMGNDQRFMLFWHLKGFMYAFQYQIIDRAITRAIQKWGEKDGMRKVAAAMPALMLAAWTLPMAALGMELRWLISPPKKGEPEGWAYAWEAMQRSGNLGLAQVMVDMYETENHGKPSVLAPLGPTVSQLYDFSTKDLLNSDGSPSNTLVRAMPAYPVMQWLGSALQ